MSTDNAPDVFTGISSQQGATESNMVPPYIAFHRFDAFMESLRGKEIPVQVTHDMMPNIDRNEQGILLRSLRFFGFLDHNGQTTPYLLQYIRASNAAQQEMLREIIQRHYRTQVSLLLAGKHAEAQASFPAHLSESVRRRCLSFLVRLAQKAGIDVQSPRSGGKRTVTHQPAIPSSSPHPQPIETHLPLGWGRECVLRHDGQLSSEDIEHIKGLLDMLAKRMKGSGE